MASYDYIFTQGTVVDGTGRPPFPADVGIAQGRVAAVTSPGALARAEARQRIDITGLTLCPGFIDLHSHADLALLEDPLDLPKVMRSYAETIEDAVEEAVSVAAESGARLQISHFMVWGTANRGRAAEYGEWIERARARGVDVAFDAYPYTAGSTVAQMSLPPWSAEGGPARQLERLRDPGARQRILEDMRPQAGVWQHATIAGVKTEKNRPLEGKNFAAAAGDAGQDVLEFLCDLLVEEELEVAHIMHLGSEPDLRQLMRHPAHSFGSDGLRLEGRPHPRLYGTFPRVLGRYVREESVLTLEQAVHKMTGANAARLRLRDRGVVAEGKAADLVVFDPRTIADRATYENPRQFPDGIHLVMVNGEAVAREGKHTGARPGRVLV